MQGRTNNSDCGVVDVCLFVQLLLCWFVRGGDLTRARVAVSKAYLDQCDRSAAYPMRRECQYSVICSSARPDQNEGVELETYWTPLGCNPVLLTVLASTRDKREPSSAPGDVKRGHGESGDPRVIAV